jgi:predicted DCC family thiol-disulfide oxidoreductase YuxK
MKALITGGTGLLGREPFANLSDAVVSSRDPARANRTLGGASAVHQGRQGPTSGPGQAVANFDIEVFYDGACPLCMREIRMLRGRDRRQRIRFVDIAADGFDAASVGLTWEALMDRIHGRLPDGTLVEGVEVFRRLYGAVGFGRLVALTRLPGITQLLDIAYHAFARNRLRLTGRCADGACELHTKPRGLSADPR